MTLKEDAYQIINYAIDKVLPDKAVKSALEGMSFPSGRLILIGIGKASWRMANAASEILGNRINSGIVITKYGHIKAKIPNIKCFEAGHPIPDENTYLATNEVIKLVKNLKKEDTVLFLISGGGSSLFESPIIDCKELEDINNQLLKCGATINEINTIRKRLSNVKGGRFAKICEPATIYSIILSDVIGNKLDVIASGPAYPDSSTCKDVLEIINKYNLILCDKTYKLLNIETPKTLNNVNTKVIGSVNELCKYAGIMAKKLGYEPIYLSSELNCEAKEAGYMLADFAKKFQNTTKSLVFIAGGETLVKVKGKGKGGRNQELALSAASLISNFKETCIFSIGSDGTDGPTDAAGGYVDGDTYQKLLKLNINVFDYLNNNDAYNALNKVNGLIFTGPTGTNVNDLSVLLIKR